MVESVELFEAISHPARIKILKILEKQPASFASLKRQLDIESSGNLDHHLKKLKQLITVREDGLYGLTDAGKEALLSIKTIELWTETERRKIKPLGKVPREALILFGLEISTAASIAYFFAMFSPSGYGLVLSAVFALLGFSSALGILAGKRWSWKTTITKSGLTMLGSVISLCYLPLFLKTSQNASPEITQFYTVGTIYAVFAVTEAIALLLALRHPVKDFLGVKYVTRLSRRAILGGVACTLSGILTIVLESWNTFSGSETTAALNVLNNVAVLGGLAVGIGGVLILLRSLTSGGLMSIIFGLFPFGLLIPFGLFTNASFAPILAYSMLGGFFGNNYVAGLIAILIGALPIAGGIFSLASMPKIPE